MQPPSGGCVLKQNEGDNHQHKDRQPPSGGCVLKLSAVIKQNLKSWQPPSGGCVLKHLTKLNPPPMQSSSRLRAAVC